MVARTSAGAELLRRYPRTYAEELGIDRLDRPSDLFRLLVLALLMSARICAVRRAHVDDAGRDVGVIAGPVYGRPSAFARRGRPSTSNRT
jgi:hypothetical protein